MNLLKKLKLIKISYVNIVFYLIIGFLIIQKVPSFYKMYSSQGTLAPASSVTDLNGNKIQLPLNKNQIVIFWATWCGPCNVELNRINKMILNKEIASDSVLAISTLEKSNYVAEFSKKHNFLFNIAVDDTGIVSQNYQIEATPTILFIEKSGIINWKTMGLSPSLEFRIKMFLQDKT